MKKNEEVSCPNFNKEPSIHQSAIKVAEAQKVPVLGV